ncbi:MAG: hypothetical protein V1797_00760 [Pseudomonadota bacterium]
MSTDRPCRQHPESPAVALCQKYGHGLCAQCLETDPQCPDPTIYCKFRPQCLIFFNYKEQGRQERQPGEMS